MSRPKTSWSIIGLDIRMAARVDIFLNGKAHAARQHEHPSASIC